MKIKILFVTQTTHESNNSKPTEVLKLTKKLFFLYGKLYFIENLIIVKDFNNCNFLIYYYIVIKHTIIIKTDKIQHMFINTQFIQFI